MRPAMNGRVMGKSTAREKPLAYSQLNIRAANWNSTHSAVLLVVGERASSLISPTMLIMRFRNSSLKRYYKDISTSHQSTDGSQGSLYLGH